MSFYMYTQHTEILLFLFFNDFGECYSSVYSSSSSKGGGSGVFSIWTRDSPLSLSLAE
jgi:uncharacterized membrane protein